MTRLYFHAAANSLSNLPTSEQSALTSNKDVDAQTVNRSMDTTIGTSQTSLVLTSNASVSPQNYYFTRFVSPALSGITSITGGGSVWSYNAATMQSNANANFPVTSIGSPRPVLYVWRPSNQTVVGTIKDAATGVPTISEPSASTEVCFNTGTWSSSTAVSGVQDGDVICFEVWFPVSQTSATAYTDTFYYDGTTVTTTAGTVSNHASFIETTQTLTFAAAGGPVDCTVTGKTIYNKTTTHA